MSRAALLLQLVRSQSNKLSFASGSQLCRYHRAVSQAWKPNSLFNTSFHRSPAHSRWLSKAAVAEDDSRISIGPRRGLEPQDNDKEDVVIYNGPMSSVIKKVKLLSLSTCCLSVSLGPVITFMTSPHLNVIFKGAVASSVILFSASTTFILHWFVSPYIHKLKWKPGSDTFEVEMLSWMATSIPQTLKFSDIRPAVTNRPYVSFKANNKFYFVHNEHCQNKALLARLTPKEAPEQESVFKNL